MAIVINGSGTVTGLAVGGLPDGTVDAGTLATNSVDSAELIDGAVDDSHMASIKGRKNLIINGGFDVWQRGTSQVSATNVESKFFADRFGIYPSGGTITADRVAFTQGQTTVPGNPNYHARIAMASGNANNWALIKTQLENPERLANKTFTISFWAKGTNPGGGKFQMYENMYHNNGGSIVSNSEVYTDVTVTSSWQKFTFTKTEAAWNSSCVLGNNNYYYWSIIQPSADNSTNAWTLDIANIQLELGSTATDFEQRSYGEELALCQRYFCMWSREDNGSANIVAQTGYWGSGTIFEGFVTFPVEMRVPPTLTTSTLSSSAKIKALNPQTSWHSATAVGVNEIGTKNAKYGWTVVNSGLSKGTGGALACLDDNTPFLKYSAEL